MALIFGIISFALIFQLFVLINPMSSFPVLMEAHKKKMDVVKIARSSVLIAFFIAVIIALSGPYLFDFFGITINSFRIAGGLVLLLLGLETIMKDDKMEVGKIDSLISIIATPLLTGPATISFITIKSYELGQISVLTNLIVAFAAVGAVFVLFAKAIPKINSKIIGIGSKVLGLFLLGMSIEMIANGVMSFVRG